MPSEADTDEAPAVNGKAEEEVVDEDAPLDDGYRHWQRIRVVSRQD